MKLTEIEKVKSFFDAYCCEHISSGTIQEIIQQFQAPEYGDSLVQYIQGKALNDDNDNEEKVYIVRNEKEQVVFYFSLKCGLLYRPTKRHSLTTDQEEYVKMLYDAIKVGNKKVLAEYKASGLLGDNWDMLYQIAENEWLVNRETNIDKGRSMPVFKVHPAIELSHFCKNGAIKERPFNMPIGVGIFWRKIVPMIDCISKEVGCKYVYLFAANVNKSDGAKPRKNLNDLITYYRDGLNFRDAQELVMLKPQYDKNCHPMLQRVSDLQAAKESIWERFEDAIDFNAVS